MTDNLAETARKSERFVLCITPEGTRSLNPDWKMGLDYKRKLIQCTKAIIPNGDVEKQMKEIKLYFKDFKGKIPENFSIGDN